MSNFLATVKTFPAKAGFAIKAHSPEILAVTGVIGIVAGTVLACKATVKAIDIHSEYKEKMQTIEEVISDPEKYSKDGVEYDPETDGDNDKLLLKVQTAAKYVKAYAPAAACIVVGVGCMLGSNYILRNRWLGISAAYAALNESLSNYRKRVSEEVGEETENNLWGGLKTIDVPKDETDENGMPVIEKKKTFTRGQLGSPYAVIFDEHDCNWTRSATSNLTFIRCCQNQANDMLRARGYLYLYEVYEMLGFRYEPKNNRYDISPEQARAAHHVGWVLDGNGDNFVDFGINHAYDKAKRAFLNGEEPSAILDFNVDGDILATMYN